MSDQIDEDLYSRQIYVLGLEAMKRMSNSSVLISGMGGLGVEIAKNIILAGVRSVTVHDTQKTTFLDLGSQFYLTEADIGKNRATACVAKLAELNQHVVVKASEEPLTNEFIGQFNTIVIATNIGFNRIGEISEFCHSKNICFTACQVSGVFGYVFNDFGDKFHVSDPRGEQPSRFMIEYITNAKEGIVTVADHERHNLTDGDFVRFEEVAGMTEINGKEYPVIVVNSYTFKIGDTSNFHEYESVGSGGYGNQIISPIDISFKTFLQAIPEPNVLDVDLTHFSDRLVLLGFLACLKFTDTHPNVQIADKLDQLITIATDLNTQIKLVDEIDDKLIKLLGKQFVYEISPMAAVFGGIVGQEVLKSLSGKFLPIDQFMTLNYQESLPENTTFTLKNDRYDSYRAVFGNAQQEKIEQLRYFMIGSGAIGCEVLKNWAMMGVATQGNGRAIVTDMDRIEKSNLARQFLFRDHDIGQMKSESACKAAQVMNPNMRIEAQTNKLDQSTRDIYNDEFYLQLDGVCNALDNIEARLFSDQMCVYYKKPLLESGTLGPKANFQMVVPYLTESYASSADPPEDNIPACTLHNFPSNMDHCCMWGRDIFSGLFEQGPEIVNKFLTQSDLFAQLKAQSNAALLDALQTIHSNLIDDRPKDFSDCVKWARQKFAEFFNWKIRDLLHMYPLDHVTKSGALFWSGAKRAPDVIEFDPKNPIHTEFIFAAATIRARIYGIKSVSQKEAINIASKVTLKEWTPTKLEIDTGDDEEKKTTVIADDDPRIISLTKDLETLKSQKISQLNIEKFEKDDDSNNHMDFIAAAANLRATNYRIPAATKLEIKRIAGKIIPAISTTTAMVCGFVCLEMYKIHNINPKKLEEYRSGFVNLAICMFALTEPIHCEKKKVPATQLEFSPLWDTIDFNGELTVKDFIDEVKNKFGLRVMTIGVDKYNIYTSYMPAAKKKDRMSKKITQVYSELSKEPVPDYLKFLRIVSICYNDEMEEVPMPDFILNFRNNK